MAGPGRNTSESRIHKTKQRRKHKTLCKSRSGTETLHGVSAGQTQVPTVAVETLNVLTRVCTVYEYEKMELENPPTDTSELISLPERFNEQSCKILREHMDVLSDGTPAEEVYRRDSGYCRGIKQGGRRIACVRCMTSHRTAST
ncbi:reverse transcriptase [Phytophthora megakarya]|uniref:Reverse transcriptase n=1 Tax=Phytophthora megakarya TaxID=4795 RepID=A0A225UFD3_9STRA|nr:reverse transcriptase [Phytophthora megakarya]